MSDVEAGSKRGNEGFEDQSYKRQRNDRDKMRFLLVGKNCGSIIGKGGENIKRLRNEFGVSMHLPDSQCRERVLAMQGNKGDCVSVLRDILTNCKEAPFAVDPKQTMNYEINFLANSEQVGAVIGKGGEKIREIRDQSGGKVKVYQDCLPNSNERVIAIGGEDETIILSAFNIVIDLLADRPAKRPTIYYDPKNKHMNDMPMSRDCNDMPDRGNQMGGNQMSMPDRGSQMGGNQMGGGSGNPLGGAGNGLGAALGGLGGLRNLSNLAGATTLLTQLGVNPQVSAALLAGAAGGLPNLQGNDQNRGEPIFSNADNRVSNINDFGPPRHNHGFDRNQHNNNNSGGRNDDRFGSNSNRDDRRGSNTDNQNQDGSSNLAQMKTEVNITVPSDLCGAIIGRSGQRIKDIKHQSGARLDFSKTEKNSKEDRVLTISGTQGQTLAAQRMIADCLENRND